MPDVRLPQLLAVPASLLVAAPAACTPERDDTTCDGRCGPGTVCRDGSCVAASAQPPPVAEEKPARKRKGKRRKRGRSNGRNRPGDTKAAESPDDSHVPPYRDDRTQMVDEASGSERLSDRAVARHMGGLEPAFNRCIASAAASTDEDLGTGQVAVEINVDPDGSVAGVSVEAPRHLRVGGLVPCLRLAVHRSRFPSWNGPPMRVSYHFQVE